MKNKTFQSKNGLTMLDCKPLNFLRQSVYAGETGAPYFYSIYVGGFADGHTCVYDDEKKTLIISYSAYSSDDPNLIFKVDSIEEASELVLKFSKGMNIKLDDTIYILTM